MCDALLHVAAGHPTYWRDFSRPAHIRKHSAEHSADQNVDGWQTSASFRDSCQGCRLMPSRVWSPASHCGRCRVSSSAGVAAAAAASTAASNELHKLAVVTTSWALLQAAACGASVCDHSRCLTADSMRQWGSAGKTGERAHSRTTVRRTGVFLAPYGPAGLMRTCCACAATHAAVSATSAKQSCCTDLM